MLQCRLSLSFLFHPSHFTSSLSSSDLVRVLHLVKPLLAFIPEVAQADRKVGAFFLVLLFFPVLLSPRFLLALDLLQSHNSQR